MEEGHPKLKFMCFVCYLCITDLFFFQKSEAWRKRNKLKYGNDILEGEAKCKSLEFDIFLFLFILFNRQIQQNQDMT